MATSSYNSNGQKLAASNWQKLCARLSQVQKGARATTRASCRDDPKWLQQARSLRNQLPEHCRDRRPWSPHALLQGLGSTDRVRELCDLAFLCTEETLRQAGEDCSHANVIRGLSCDVSQNVQRKPWGTLRTLTTNSCVYVFELDRVLLPEEGLRLLGFPTLPMMKHITPGEMHEFMGQAMALPAVAQASLCLLLGAYETGSIPSLFGGPQREEP